MDNTFFVELIETYDGEEKVSSVLNTGCAYNFAVNGEAWALVDDEEPRTISKLYAEDEDEFLSEFASAWTYLMTADCFVGPRGNACSNVMTNTVLDETTSGSSETLIRASIAFATVLLEPSWVSIKSC